MLDDVCRPDPLVEDADPEVSRPDPLVEDDDPEVCRPDPRLVDDDPVFDDVPPSHVFSGEFVSQANRPLQ